VSFYVSMINICHVFYYIYINDKYEIFFVDPNYIANILKVDVVLGTNAD